MNALTFQITLEEPVLATQPYSGEANSRTSFPFIPGSMIRGALIRSYTLENRNDDLMSDDSARRLFFDSEVRFLNAYPMQPKSKDRTLPRPLSWFTEKKDLAKADAKMQDFAVLRESKLKNPKNSKFRFCHIVGDQVYLIDSARQVLVHNASDDRNLKGQDTSNVFRYEALAPGQEFAGVILVDSGDHLSEDIDVLQRFLKQGGFAFGGAHTGGYGRAKISNIKRRANWREYDTGTATADSKGLAIITLLSDAILRADNGQIAAMLKEALGIRRPENEKEYRAYLKTDLVGGFNRQWGLPLPQSRVVAAGSVFRCPADAIDRDEINELVKHGIGERRVEGFGRIALNMQTQKQLQGVKLDFLSRKATVDLSQESRNLALLLANRRLRQELEKKLAELLSDANTKLPHKLPTSSQLSRVRVAARHALLTNDKKRGENEQGKIAEHMKFIKQHGAKDDWERVWFEGKSLFDWVIETSELAPEEFRITFRLPTSLPSVAEATAQLTDGIRTEFCARYIDGVMKLGVRLNKQRMEQGDESTVAE